MSEIYPIHHRVDVVADVQNDVVDGMVSDAVYCHHHRHLHHLHHHLRCRSRHRRCSMYDVECVDATIGNRDAIHQAQQQQNILNPNNF